MSDNGTFIYVIIGGIFFLLIALGIGASKGILTKFRAIYNGFNTIASFNISESTKSTKSKTSTSSSRRLAGNANVSNSYNGMNNNNGF